MRKAVVNTSKLKLKRGDKIQVTAGNHKGQVGQILKVIPKENRAVVEGINMVTKHVKPTSQKPEGGIERFEAPLQISNLVLLDPKTGKPTKVGRKLDPATGKLKRYSKKTGEFID